MKPHPGSHAINSCVLFLVALTVLAHTAAGQVITVDNSDPDFTLLHGAWNSGAYGNPHGADYDWTLTTSGGGAPALAEWRPHLPEAGVYQVAVWYVQGSNRADNAPFTVNHASGSITIPVNQQTAGETWLVLGSFAFEEGTTGYVTLGNSANPSVVIADAVRFTPETSEVQLTMEASPAAWGSTDPLEGGPYARYLNEVVPISAAAAPGYQFHHWEVSVGAQVANPSAAETTVVMDDSKTVMAVFVEEGLVSPEFRGFWADAFHTGFKSAAQIDAMVARAVAGNYNAIVAEVLAYQDTSGSGHGAYWNSAILPKATDISGGIDPLAYLVQQAHANGIEVHPWLVAFRVSTAWPPSGNSILTAHPEWLMVPRSSTGGGPATVDGKYVLDPGSPDVQDYLLSIVRELLTEYDVDGIHWDYIRYTSTDAGYPAYTWYDKSGLARFRQVTGYSGTPSTGYGPWNDFRRRGITELVRRAQLEVAVTAADPNQPRRHSAALITWGNAPPSFQSTSSWALFQNWREWMEMGYLDAGIPMTYYDDDAYPSWYRNWVDQGLVWSYGRHLFVGPGIYLNDFADSLDQIEYAQDAGADGICTYSYASTSDAGADWTWYPYVASNAFAEPAPPPEMPWRDPAVTVVGAVYGRVTDGATGEPIDDATVKGNGFPLAQTDGNGFFIVTRLGTEPGGTYYPLSAVKDGYAEVLRPAVLIERAGYSEANFALGDWLPGDYDVDGDVDWQDFARLEGCLTGPAADSPAAGCDLFDFDGDDDVDLLDYQVLGASFAG